MGQLLDETFYDVLGSLGMSQNDLDEVGTRNHTNNSGIPILQ